MAEENGKPKVGRSARLLGVRLGVDVDVVEMPRATMFLEKYEAALANTQNDWQKVG